MVFLVRSLLDLVLVILHVLFIDLTSLLNHDFGVCVSVELKALFLCKYSVHRRMFGTGLFTFEGYLNRYLSDMLI